MIRQPAYIVAEIPDPIRSGVQALRDSLKTYVSRLPVEITLAGSSGVGPIPVGTDLSLVEAGLDRALLGVSPFRVMFSGIRSFPGGACFYLAPCDRAPFDQLHRALTSTGIPFSGSPFPYTPHCTLRLGAPLSDAEATNPDNS